MKNIDTLVEDIYSLFSLDPIDMEEKEVDKHIDRQIKKRNEYLKEAEVDSAPQDWVKELLKQTKENMGKK